VDKRRNTIYDTKCSFPGCNVVRSAKGIPQHMSKAHGINGKEDHFVKVDPQKLIKLQRRINKNNNMDSGGLIQLLSEGYKLLNHKNNSSKSA
jgi:hypothetical protein